jgi:pyruvate formate lyase activating enzyme
MRGIRLMIFAIKPFEIHDGDGIRTTIFFKGCPLRCQWCHNPESFSFQKDILFDVERCEHCLRCTDLCSANPIQYGKHVFVRTNCIFCGKCESICPQKAFEISGLEMTAEEIAQQALKDELFMKSSGGGVTFSGGEPLMQVDLCIQIARLLKERDIHIAIDTCGYVNRQAIDAILPYADTFLFDIKAIDEDVHIACTGVSNRIILENIKYVDSLGIPIEIRYPYVPTMNDDQVEKIAHFVRQLHNVKEFRLLPYHNYAEGKYVSLGQPDAFTDFPLPTEEMLSRALQTLKDCGVTQATRF